MGELKKENNGNRSQKGGGNNTEIRGWGVQFGVGGRKRRMNNRK